MGKKPSKALIVLGALIALAAFGRIADVFTGGTTTAERSAPAPAAAPASAASAEPSKQAPPPSEPQPAVPPAAPTPDQLAIDAAYDAAHAKDPSADAYERAARKLKVSKAAVLDAVSTVAEYRAALLDSAKRSVEGIVGDIDIKSIARTDLGTHTAIVSFTAVRCPEGDPRRDKDLELLATTALKTIATTLPEPIDSYRAALWYRGISCERGSLGYGATWTRAKNKLTLE